MGLNNEQLQAVNSTSDRILCLAGAGAGKTKTMLDRISKLVTDGGVAPSAILALTFTNAAASEMKSRYEKLNPGKETPEFRTFHSFCYSLICKDANIRGALGYDNIPGIASDEQMKALEEKAKAQCKITLSKEKLKTRTGLDKKEQYQADLYDKALTRVLRMENVITFDRLNSEVAELFGADHSATAPYKAKYKHIFVDEFQDTDTYQIRFLNSFPDTNFYFCGDCLQNIYSFRGTSNEYIKALSNTDSWDKIKLFTNYRSTNQICEYANKFSKGYADASYRIEMQGIRDGERVVTKLVDGPSRYSSMAEKDIRAVIEEYKSLTGTTAILCRTNKEVGAVASYLQTAGINFERNKDSQRTNLIDCALSDTYMLGWLASYLPSNKYGEYIRLSSTVANPDINWFLSVYGNNPQIKQDFETAMALRAMSSTSEFSNTKLSQVAKLLNLSSIPTPDKGYVGAEFLQYLKTVVADVKSSELYIGTIHSVKGLEYDNVFVMNVGAYSFPLNTEDNKNLFYVAITRAKNRLYIYEVLDF